MGGETFQMQIERVFRVEDSAMWERYERSISYISEARQNEETAISDMTSPHGSLQRPSLTTEAMPVNFFERLRLNANEVYLWHGTDREAAESIILNSFDTKLAGAAHAKILGRGVYLAEDCSLADRYSPPGPD